MGVIKNREGIKYGKLTVTKFSGLRNHRTYWMCQCDCGCILEVAGGSLDSGNTQTCGRCPVNTYYEHIDGYMVGVTTKGEEFFFDKEDFELVKKLNVFIDCGYPVTKTLGKRIRLHNLIMNPANEFIVDHINSNKVDARRCNLRLCNDAQNARNRHKQKGTYSSKYKGVSRHKSGKYVAYIGYNNKRIHIGTYSTECEAAIAYNEKAKDLYGEFSKLNIIEAA